jgi:hypothetical protein
MEDALKYSCDILRTARGCHTRKTENFVRQKIGILYVISITYILYNVSFPCAPLHEDVWENENTASLILGTQTRWECVVSFTLRPLFPCRSPYMTRYTGVWETEDIDQQILKTKTVYGQLQRLATLYPWKWPTVEI